MSMNPGERTKIMRTEKKLRASLMAATIQTKLFNETPDTIYAVDLFQISQKTALK